MLEETTPIIISKMQVQATVRDGGLAIAESRGVFRDIYIITIPRLDPRRLRNTLLIRRKHY